MAQKAGRNRETAGRAPGGARTRARRLRRRLAPLAGALALALPAGAAADVTDGLVLHYKLDETSGTVASDSSPTGRDATVEGGAAWEGGEGLGFTGANHVRMPDDVLAGVDEITVAFDVWIDPTLTPNYFFFNFGNSSDGQCAGCLFASDGAGNANFRGAITPTNWQGEQGPVRSGPLPRGTWTHVAFSLAGSEARLYADGEEVASASDITLAPGDIGGGETSANYIGRSPYSADKLFVGRIKNFRVYDRALDAGEVAELAEDEELSDEEAVAAAAQQLVVHDVEDVRGNLHLPTEGAHGASVSWESSDPGVISTDGIVNRPARGEGDVTVELTATLAVGEATATRTFEAHVRELPAQAPLAGYVFSYFTGEGLANGEQIYFALSEGNDPLHWHELNGGQPVLTSDLGTKGLRDPFIIRSPEGDKFFLIATDLRMFGSGDWDGAQRHGSKSIMVWESTDLVNWTDQRLVRVSPDTAGNTWAPEAYYDPQLGEYVVFWASSIFGEDNPGHTGPLPHNRMMYATTRDFHTFSEPRVWYDPGYAVIDSTVIEHDGTFYRYTKDERGRSQSTPCGKFVFADRASSLLGDYEFIRECIGQGAINQGEGPTVFKSNTEERWYMFIDEFGGRGYVPFETTDLSTGEWDLLPAQDYDLPSRPRHGTVLPITRAEWIRLQEAYGDECVPAGNCYPDSEAPVTTVELDPAEPGPGGTYEGPVTVRFSADDGELGSGVERTLYSHNGGPFTEYDPEAPPTITEPGFHQVIYRSVDAHGNFESLRQVTFTIAEPPAPGDPELAIGVKPKRKRAKANRAVALRVTVRNVGESAAGRARVCVKVAKRKARVAGKACRKLGALPAGEATAQRFKVKPTRRARGKRVKVTFTANAQGAKPARASAVLRVRR